MSTQRTSVHAEAGLHRKLVLFAVQLEGYLAHFPNCHKYTLTQGIRQAFVDVYNLVTEAQKRYQKKTTLTQLDIRHEQLRMQVHLAHELGLFGYSAGKKDAQAQAAHRFTVLLRMIDELGRMIGGWLKTELQGSSNAALGEKPTGLVAGGAVGA